MAALILCSIISGLCIAIYENKRKRTEQFDSKKNKNLWLILTTASMFDFIGFAFDYSQRETTDTEIIFHIVWGLASLIIGIMLFRTDFYIPIKAVITDFKARDVQENLPNSVKYPIYEYMYNGETKYYHGQCDEIAKKYAKGAIVNLYVNKQTDEVMECATKDKDNVQALIFTTIGIASLATAAWLLFK